MKKIFAITTALLFPSIIQAATWTVDNNTAHPANFRTIQAAIDGAEVGDTILVAGSPTSYGGFTSTKRLNIKGEMPSEMGLGTRIVAQGECLLTEVFNIASPDHLRNAGGSHLEGLFFSNGLRVDGPCSGVTIKRCFVDSDIRLWGTAGTLISNCRVDVIQIHSGTVNGRNFTGTGNNVVGTWAYQFYPTSPTNTLAENCVFGYYEDGLFQDALRLEGGSNPPALIRNSIIISKNDTAVEIQRAVFDHCLLIGIATLPATNGNISLPYSEFANVFVDATFYTNAPPAEAFALKAGSPAIGAGVGGVDMGMYAGVAPFVPGQVPALPRISRLAVPLIVPSGTGLTFEVRAEARD